MPREVVKVLPTCDGAPTAYGARTLMSATPEVNSTETAPRSAYAAYATTKTAIEHAIADSRATMNPSVIVDAANLPGGCRQVDYWCALHKLPIAVPFRRRS